MVNFNKTIIPNQKLIKGSLFRKVYTRDDFKKTRYYGNDVFVFQDINVFGIKKFITMEKDFDKTLAEINSIPPIRHIIPYYSLAQLIEYVIGDYDFSVITAAYLSELMALGTITINITDDLIRKEYKTSPSFIRIQNLYIYAKIPNEIKYPIRLLADGYGRI